MRVRTFHIDKNKLKQYSLQQKIVYSFNCNKLLIIYISQAILFVYLKNLSIYSAFTGDLNCTHTHWCFDIRNNIKKQHQHQQYFHLKAYCLCHVLNCYRCVLLNAFRSLFVSKCVSVFAVPFFFSFVFT